VGGIVIEVNDEILKIMRNWILFVAGSMILMSITLLFIYYGSDFIPKIIFQILAVIQFSLIIFGIVYYLKVRTLKRSI